MNLNARLSLGMLNNNQLLLMTDIGFGSSTVPIILIGRLT